MSWEIKQGDCLEVLAELEEASIDSIVVDPPYGLSKEPDIATVLTHWLAGDNYEHRGSGFMGQSWDSFVPGPSVWRECLRVLKPGGHMLCFAGSRTVDLMGISIRLAGFRIRDQIQYLYGSGFPKSHDIGKALDRRPGVAQHPAFAEHLTARREAAGLSCRDVSERVVGTRSGACWNWEHHQFPKAKWWPALRDLLALDQAWGEVVAEADREKVGVKRAGIATPGDRDRHTVGGSKSVEVDITSPATDKASEWEGWGTALKPAHEPIIVAQKALSGTFAANVLEHGTGAINIDGCRIEADDKATFPVGDYGDRGLYGANGERTDDPNREGRWPANVIMDPEAGAMLDAQAGERGGSGKASGSTLTGTSESVARGKFNGVEDTPFYGDAGGPSRFYYCAKSSSAERNVGLDDLSDVPGGMRPETSGQHITRRDGDDPGPTKNHHPTVKPIDLMRWCVRLVTPPGGTVLDCFTGSGTTGIAAVLEDFDFVGIEREPEYIEIASARIDWWNERIGSVADILEIAGFSDKARTIHSEAGQLDLLGETT